MMLIKDTYICDVSFPSIKLPGKWRIWGLTFYNTSELMELAGAKCLSWPLFDVSSGPMRILVFALHGYWELMDPTRAKERGVDKHKDCLVLTVSLAFTLLYTLCDYIWMAGIKSREMLRMNRMRLAGPPTMAGLPQPVQLPAELPELPTEYDSSIHLIR